MPFKDPARMKEYQRKWMRRRRGDFFRHAACIQCGGIEELEVDHIDPELKVSHRFWSWSEERRNEELAKCQVLCKGCHQTKTTAYRRGREGSTDG